MTFARRLRPRPWPSVAAVGLLALLVANVPAAGVDPVHGQWIWAAVCLLAGVRIVTRAGGPYRVPWLLLGAGVLVWSAGALWYAAFVAGREGVPYPSPADLLWLAAYGPLLAAGVLLARGGLTRGGRTVTLDGVVAAVGTAAVGAAALAPLLDHERTDALGIAVTLAYPVIDTLLLGVAVAAYVVAGGRMGRTWRRLGAGLLLLAASDLTFAAEVAAGGGTWTLGGFADLGWPLAFWVVAGTPAPDRAVPAAPRRTGVLPVVPLTGAALALAVLVLDRVTPVAESALVLAVAAIVLALVSAALTLRTNVALRDHAERAFRDELTGLANRRRLMDDLTLVVERAPAPATLALFDLDGFKSYNDAYGHPAGDALLAALGQRLRRAVQGTGEAYRLGGDEFCVLIGDRDVDHELVLDRAVEALRQEGDGFAVGASYGRVSVPDDAASAAEALQLADTRMYARKDAGRASTRRQSRDLLLQLLHEQQPDLEEHSGDVGELVVAVGRRLGLDAERLDHARHAAELHDVGKVAIPAAILGKPGPLDDDEWALMKRHTIIGERILSAVPALVPVGRIVRATHERWDGGGYPDGLRGEEIPLAARVIAVCDTFHAITTDRAYRAGRPADEALAELRRCAGTQFDPAVVEAFAAELASGTAPGDGGADADAAAGEVAARRVAPAGAIAQNAAGELAELAKLRGLLHAAQLARGGADVAEVLDAIADTIAASLGFRVVSINVHRPAWDDFLCTAVHGDPAVRERLLGKVEPAASWQPWLDERFARGDAYFVPAGSVDFEDDDDVIWHVPDIAPSDDPGAWHPDDVLFVPLRSTTGEVLGMVSVDEPVWGRRPSDAELEVLAAVAAHAAVAVQSARSAAIARAAQAAEVRVAALGRELTTPLAPDEVAARVTACVLEALPFRHAEVQLLCDPAAAAAAEALLAGLPERHGCVVLDGDRAAAAREWLERGPSPHRGRGPRGWRDHLVAAPVRGADGALLAVLWVDDPADRLVPEGSTLRALRGIAALAALPLAWGRRVPAPARDLEAA